MLVRVWQVLRSGAQGFLGGALSAEEKSRLGVARYEASDEYRDEPRYPWEDAWLGGGLPGPPARVLVGAAGGGREVVRLVAAGYAVTALEPSASLAALCRSRAPSVCVVEGRYEDLVGGAAQVRERLGEDAGPLVEAWSGARPFEAVLMGLGSLSHLLNGGMRAVVGRALAKMCPEGPILGSALAPPREQRAGKGRAARVGRALAQPIRAARGLGADDPNEVPFGGLGFAKMFTREELRAFGDAMGRRTVFDAAAPEGMELCIWPPQR